jgi:exopolysaccharide biosynthesis polyprenyl glycosylphosphotransferase
LSEQAGTDKHGDKWPRQRSENFFIRAPGVRFLLTDTLLLLGALITCRVLVGRLDLATVTFTGGLLLLQVSSELRHPHRAELSALDETAPVFRRVCVAYAFASALALLSRSGDSTSLLVVAVVTVPLLLVGRSASYTLERSFRRKGQRRRTLVVGGGEVAKRIVTALRFCTDFGLEVVGVVDDESESSMSQRSGVILGTLSDLPRVIHSHRIDTIVVAFDGRSDAESEMTELVRGLLSDGINVWVIPRFHGFGVHGKRVEDLWGVPVVKLAPPGPARVEWPMKRGLDVVVAGFGLLLAAPLMVVSAALILVESGRPVLFRQRRVGAGGRDFHMLKFRTMAVCGDKVNETEWVADRERTTRVGSLLRASGLDELPQLFNVLRGDMSLVGPRPERPFFVDRFASTYPDYGARHRVLGGITGWSQIHGLRGDTSIEHRAAADNYYIDTWSLSADLKILLRSVPSVIRSRQLISADNLDDVPLIVQHSSGIQASTIDLDESDADSRATAGQYGVGVRMK